MTADGANGTGMRVSVFVSGCLNHCPGCFQPETWDFHYGREYTAEMEQGILDELAKPYYRGLTLLGGDPMEESNQKELLPLLRRMNALLPARDLWVYTGYIYDRDLVPGGRRYFGDVTEEFLDRTDILVDGPFLQEQKDVTLRFRGSANQRIIDMKATRAAGSVVLDRETADV